MTTQSENERVQTALDHMAVDLQRHEAMLLKLQGELMASRLEVTGARGETVHYQGLLRRTQAEVEARHDQLLACQAALAPLQAEVAAANARAQGLDRQIAALYASLSWKVSRPVRLIGRLMGRR